MKDKNSEPTPVNLSNSRGNYTQASDQETSWDPGEQYLNQQIEMKYLIQRKANRLNRKEGKAWSEWIDNKITNLHMEMMTGKGPTDQAGIGQELLDETRLIMMRQEQDDELAINQFWKDRGQWEPTPYSISSWHKNLKRDASRLPKVKTRNKNNLINSCPPPHEVIPDTGLEGQDDNSVSALQLQCQYEDEGEVKGGEKGTGRKGKRKNNGKEIENVKGKESQKKWNNSDFPPGNCVKANTLPL